VLTHSRARISALKLLVAATAVRAAATNAVSSGFLLQDDANALVDMASASNVLR
jgi:hypothetical protein